MISRLRKNRQTIICHNPMKKRIDILRRKLLADGLDAFLVTDLVNIKYLTGFTGSNGLLAVTAKKSLLITDFRYKDSAVKETTGCKVLISRGGLFEALYTFGFLSKAYKVGFEGSISYQLGTKIKMLFSHAKLTAFEDYIEEFMTIKNYEEIKLTKKAIEISDKVFIEALSFVKPGLTENEIAAELSYRMKKYGSEMDSFDIIVASGLNSSMPHAKVTNKKLKNNEALLLDFGACVGGYRSDMTRTIFIGKPKQEFLDIYQIVLDAQNIALDNARAGLLAEDFDGLARDYITKKGYGKYFGHSLGHGVGLRIHERPRVSYLSKETLAENMIITVEPGIYLPDKFGVRIEDNIIIKKNGSINLTKSPKELITL